LCTADHRSSLGLRSMRSMRSSNSALACDETARAVASTSIFLSAQHSSQIRCSHWRARVFAVLILAQTANTSAGNWILSGASSQAHQPQPADSPATLSSSCNSNCPSLTGRGRRSRYVAMPSFSKTAHLPNTGSSLHRTASCAETRQNRKMHDPRSAISL